MGLQIVSTTICYRSYNCIPFCKGKRVARPPSKDWVTPFVQGFNPTWYSLTKQEHRQINNYSVPWNQSVQMYPHSQINNTLTLTFEIFVKKKISVKCSLRTLELWWTLAERIKAMFRAFVKHSRHMTQL